MYLVKQAFLYIFISTFVPFINCSFTLPILKPLAIHL